MRSARALNDPSYPTAGAPRPLLTGEEYDYTKSEAENLRDRK